MSHMRSGALFRPQIQLEVDYPANCLRPPRLGLRPESSREINHLPGYRRQARACSVAGASNYCNAIVMLHCSIRDAMKGVLNIRAEGSQMLLGAGPSPEAIPRYRTDAPGGGSRRPSLSAARPKGAQSCL